MTKVDFQVLCLQVLGSLKISEVQVRVCYWSGFHLTVELGLVLVLVLVLLRPLVG